jgi:hypothetical protein
MSALPPKADITHEMTEVRFGPEADIGRESELISYDLFQNASPASEFTSGHF